MRRSCQRCVLSPIERPVLHGMGHRRGAGRRALLLKIPLPCRMCSQTLEGEGLSETNSRKCACLLAEITYRKTQVLVPAPHAAQFAVGTAPKQRGKHHPHDLAEQLLLASQAP